VTQKLKTAFDNKGRHFASTVTCQYPVQRLSCLVPVGIIATVGYFTSVSWWAMAMMCGAILFAWDWLWGDSSLLDRRYGVVLIALGLACLVVSYFLAAGLGVSLVDCQRLGDHLSRYTRWLYQLPAIGLGVMIYGLLIWSRSLSDGDNV
jgi:hypothetical protein